jgi:flagellar biosynthetic protein FliP
VTWHRAARLLWLVPLLWACLALAAHAADLPLVTTTPAAGGGENYSLPVTTLLVLTALTLIPAALLLMTSFTRIIIVLSLLRQALGTQSAPPNQVLIGLALFLTLFVMGPALNQIYANSYVPWSENKIGFNQALTRAAMPLRKFMFRQTREADLALFVKLAHEPALKTRDDVPLRVLVPAFVTSELKTAFQIGFLIFIPFLIIDMVVASVLMSMGMMMLSPMLISLPFKLMLFVLVDGWNLLLGSLISSFG